MIQPIESLTSQYSSVPRLKMLTLSVRAARSPMQHRVDAVLHVEVRLALAGRCRARAARRVVAQAAVEVEDVAVRVALAEDRHEAEDVALEAEALAVGLDQAFAGELRGAVQRGLDRERRVLRASGRRPARRRSSRSRRTRSAGRR